MMYLWYIYDVFMVYLRYIYGICMVIFSGYDLLMLSSSTGTHRIHGAGILMLTSIWGILMGSMLP